MSFLPYRFKSYLGIPEPIKKPGIYNTYQLGCILKLEINSFFKLRNFTTKGKIIQIKVFCSSFHCVLDTRRQHLINDLAAVGNFKNSKHAVPSIKCIEYYH